jgi:hypothetical protein
MRIDSTVFITTYLKLEAMLDFHLASFPLEHGGGIYNPQSGKL